MLGMKVVVLLGQVGKIWSKNRNEIKVLQTMTAIAFFALFLKGKDNDKEEYNNFKKQN